MVATIFFIRFFHFEEHIYLVFLFAKIPQKLFLSFLLISINRCDTMTPIWAFSPNRLERGIDICQTST